eukprot:scaffold286175_cov51-Attheya_sp.AAC.1
MPLICMNLGSLAAPYYHGGGLLPKDTSYRTRVVLTPANFSPKGYWGLRSLSITEVLSAFDWLNIYVQKMIDLKCSAPPIPAFLDLYLRPYVEDLATEDAALARKRSNLDISEVTGMKLVPRKDALLGPFQEADWMEASSYTALPRADSKADLREGNTQIRDSKLEIRSDEHLRNPDLDASAPSLAPETAQAKSGQGRDTNILDSSSQGGNSIETVGLPSVNQDCEKTRERNEQLSENNINLRREALLEEARLAQLEVSVPVNPDLDSLDHDPGSKESLEEIAREMRERKATKSKVDDAAVPEYLWESHLIEDGSPFGETVDVTLLRYFSKGLRSLMLCWWGGKVTLSFLAWLRIEHPVLKDIDEKYKCVERLRETGGETDGWPAIGTLKLAQMPFCEHLVVIGECGLMAPDLFTGDGSRNIRVPLEMVYRCILNQFLQNVVRPRETPRILP